MSETQLESIKSNEPAAKAEAWRRPVYDVSEDPNGFRIRVQLPGVKREGVEISMEDETLRITGTRAQAVPKSWRPLSRELPGGNFRLNLRLNVPIDDGKIKARVEQGVLDLDLPKADAVKPRKIEVN